METSPRTVSVMIVIAAIGMLACTTPNRADAASVQFPLQSYQVIQDTTGARARVLLNFGNFDTLIGMKILYASCEVGLNLEECFEAGQGLEIRPVTRSWVAGSVSWFEPWDSAGGDFSDAYGRVRGTLAGPDAEFLITHILQAVADNTLSSNGLAVLLDGRPCDVTFSGSATRPGNGLGVLRVVYTER